MTPLVVAGSLLHFLGSLSYFRNTLLGRTKPNRITFLIWAVSRLLAFTIGIASGGGWALLPVFMSGFAIFLILSASFVNPNAYWKLGMLDFSCGVLAVVALILWVIADQPLYAVIFALMADALASFPTLLKAWKYPETETGLGYAMATLNACIGLIALSSITFINAAFLVYLILIGSVIVWGIYRRNPLQKLRSELAR